MTRIYPFQRTARWLSLGFLAAALLLGSWASAWAQEDKPADEPKKETTKTGKPIDSRNMIQNADGEWVEIQHRDFPEVRHRKSTDPDTLEKALSPHHAMLHKLVGNWQTRVRLHPGPGAEPVDSEGMADSELVLEGRALQTSYTGEFDGRKMKGIGLDGYDLDLGHHFSFWMDTTNTGATYVSGDCSHEGNDVVTSVGEFKDPQTGEMVERKTILTVLSTSQYTYEEWHTRGEGKPQLAMQVIFSKVN